ncbi:MAG: gamma-glutamyltransferase [Gammaproteobacteria bacterium]|nr:gamma-glutamyltransferase [Gammaproteobacteria bacterium]
MPTRMRRGSGFVLLCVAAGTLHSTGPTPLFAQNGVVASRSPIASEVGVEIMRTGGNAVDAAVATGFALAVTYPSAGNLGGGGFVLIHTAEGEVVANDHREKAPLAATHDMYLDEEGEVVEGLSTASPLAVGVPGTVDGLLAALERHGTISRREAIAPALRLARHGFPLPHDIAQQLASRREAFAEHPATLAVFSKPDGEPFAAGDLFRQPDLAASLERIAEQGRDGFYQGETADLIVREMEQIGGLVTREDLAAYRSAWREPVRGTYREHEIVAMPPPSSGGVLLVQMLNMLEPFDVRGSGFGSAATIHRMIEAERRAYADRAVHLGDPDFYDVPIGHLTSKDYALERLADFDPKAASSSDNIAAGQLPPEGPETTHVSVMDAAGNAVAYTTTLNFSFGAKMVVTGAGFLLNNEMDDFSARPFTPNAYGLIGGEANAIAPGKRMLSSMTPTIVLKEGKPWLVTGSPGGSTIITTVLQVIVNAIDHGMDLGDAVAAPRFHHQWQPNRVIVERHGISPDTRALLEAMGHEQLVEIRWGRGIGDANSAMRAPAGLTAVAAPRNAGGAAGL